MAEEDKKQSAAAPAWAEGQPKRKPPVNRKVALIIGGVIVCVLLIVGVVWWLHARNYESTDDAFIDAHVVRIAPRIAGQVAHVLVHDNELVAAGDLLVE